MKKMSRTRKNSRQVMLTSLTMLMILSSPFFTNGLIPSTQSNIRRCPKTIDLLPDTISVAQSVLNEVSFSQILNFAIVPVVYFIYDTKNREMKEYMETTNSDMNNKLSKVKEEVDEKVTTLENQLIKLQQKDLSSTKESLSFLSKDLEQLKSEINSNKDLVRSFNSKTDKSTSSTNKQLNDFEQRLKNAQTLNARERAAIRSDIKKESILLEKNIKKTLSELKTQVDDIEILQQLGPNTNKQSGSNTKLFSKLENKVENLKNEIDTLKSLNDKKDSFEKIKTEIIEKKNKLEQLKDNNNQTNDLEHTENFSLKNLGINSEVLFLGIGSIYTVVTIFQIYMQLFR